MSNKIISNRLSSVLPKIISDNQLGFVKGRLITENILLEQNIVHGINKKTKDGNIVIKLDMSKTYDKISWKFLTTTLRKLNFSKAVIDIIFRLISDN